MGEVNEDARRALLDELDVVEAADYRAVVSSNRWLRDRAERAERERDALRADAARYRELCREWSAALSADAEPKEWELPGMWEAADLSGGASDGAITEPSRAEGDAIPTGMRSAVGGTPRGHGGTTTGNAEGGRPREADPQGTSPGNGDASVDGGGDDGRGRAAIATEAVEQAARSRMAEGRVRELEAVLSLFAGLSEHCARFGVTETALVNVSLLDRAHAAWQGGGGA